MKAYNLISSARRVLPYTFTLLSARGNMEKWGAYWRYYSNLLYGSKLGRVRMRVTLPNGDKAIIRPLSQDDSIITEIFNYKTYDKIIAKKGGVVFDIGAHIGLFTLKTVREIGPLGKIIAVEPLPENYDILVKNLSLNKLNNVIPIKAAVGGFNGSINLHYDEGLSLSSSIIYANGRKTMKVPLFTVDKLMMDNKIDSVDLIKMDVEGAELDVLKGAVNTIEKWHPFIEMEVHGPYNEKLCSTFLLERGYDLEVEERNGLSYLFARV